MPRHSKPGLQPHRSPSILLSVRTRPPSSNSTSKSKVLPQHIGDTLTLRTTTPWPRKLNHHLQYFQRIAYRVLADPELSQTKVFRFCAPIVTFLTIIIIIAILPDFVDGTHSNLEVSGFNMASLYQEWVYLLMILVLAVLGVLSILRLLIWITSYSVRLFVQENFSARGSSSPRMFDTVMGGLFSS